jgi:hypothetical protein
LDSQTATGSPATEADLEEQVFLLRFGTGDYELFRLALFERPELRSCKEALADAGICDHLTEHGFIFVKPEQYSTVLQALTGIKLHPFHVLITQSLEPALEDTLKTLSYRKRPREKKGDRLVVSRGLSPQNGQAGRELLRQRRSSALQERTFICTVKRTFICSAPIRRPAHMVRQSTTELVVDSSQYHYRYFRGKNPRR